jgi:hypothetical protein
MTVYRSAQGKPVDMSKLSARNEKVRAVGNMNVNARGDTLDGNNKVIQDNTRRVKNNYQKATQGNQVTKPAPARPAMVEAPQLLESEKDLFDDDEDVVK